MRALDEFELRLLTHHAHLATRSLDLQLLPCVIPQEVVEKPPKRKVSPSQMDRILAMIAVKHNLKPHDILCKVRHRANVRARWEFCYRAARDTTGSFPTIGRFLGVDHTTVMWAVNSYCHAHNLPHPRGYVISDVVAKKAAARKKWSDKRRNAKANTAAPPLDQ
jgi:chromosomal replication initiation ATPase DnaA